MSFIFIVAAFVMAIAALRKISALNERVAELSQQVAKLSKIVLGPLAGTQAKEAADSPVLSQSAKTAALTPMKSAAAAIPDIISESATAEAPRWITQAPAAAQIASPEAIKPSRPIPAPKRDIEQAIASRWLVWVGGLAIAIGGLLFVKYAHENSLLSPAMQVVLGLLLAGALMFAGERLLRSSDSRIVENYVPAALSAAGLVTAFGSIFAAYALYELIEPGAAFIGLALVGLGALALSLRQGPLIAALGLIGSYATPSIIPSEHPSAWSFFPYLLIIMAACFAVLRRRPWPWLGFAAIAGSAIWAFLWLAGPLDCRILCLLAFSRCASARYRCWACRFGRR